MNKTLCTMDRRYLIKNLKKIMGDFPTYHNIFSERKPPTYLIKDRTEKDNITIVTLCYSVDRENEVPAIMIIPKNFGSLMPACLCLHQTTLPCTIGKNEPVGINGDQNLYYGAELAERGFVVFCPDYPMFGEYDLDINDVYRKWSYQSVSMKAVWNHIRAIDLISSFDFIDEERISCIGHSLGGTNSILLGCFDKRISVFVSSCGFSDFTSYAKFSINAPKKDLAGWSRYEKYMPNIEKIYNKDPKKIPIKFEEILSLLAPRALFVNAPINDDVFPHIGVVHCIDYAKNVYRQSDNSNLLYAVYPKAQHEFPNEIREKAYKFIEKYI